MVLEILCVEPIYPQYSGVLETSLALRNCFFEVLGSGSVKTGRFSQVLLYYAITGNVLKVKYSYFKHQTF